MEIDKESNQQRINSVPAPADTTFGALITIPDPGYAAGNLLEFLDEVLGSRSTDKKP